MKRSHSRSRGGKGASTAGGGAPSAPVFSTAIVSNGDTTHVILTYNVTLGTSTSTTIGDYTLTSSGKSISAVSRVGATISLTTTAWANGDTGTIAVAAGKVFEATNTTAAGALSAQSITNNVASSLTPFTETWPGINGAALPAGWNTIVGAPLQDGFNKVKFFAASGAEFINRNAGASDFTLTVSNMFKCGLWPFIHARSPSTGTGDGYEIIMRADTGKLQFYEVVSGATSNTVTGLTTLTDSVAYGVKVICSGTTVTVQLDSGGGYVTELGPITVSTNLTNTYIGIGDAVANGSSVSLYGQIQVS